MREATFTHTNTYFVFIRLDNVHTIGILTLQGGTW